tara:strand:+ start:3736 stop:4374 length:639 start_codon:yes stop_codon:yes gene_type:complete
MKTIATPKGTARYCWLTNPSKGEYDGKYGTYRTELVLDEADWTALKNQIKPDYEEAYKAECAKQGKGELKRADLPFYIDKDGKHFIKTKMKGGGERKDGSEYKLSVALFDAKANPITDDTIIGGGSTIKLGLKLQFWFVSTLGFGMRFEPQGVQVIELIPVGKAENASSFGFSAEESGYAHGGETFEQTLDQPTNDNAETTKEEAKPSAADF